MELFLLCLSLLGTVDGRIPLRHSNSTISNGTSAISSTTSSTAVVGNYIAAGLGLSSSETLQSDEMTSTTSSSTKSSSTNHAVESSGPATSSISIISTSSSKHSSSDESAHSNSASLSTDALVQNQSTFASNTSSHTIHVPVIAIATSESHTSSTSDNATASSHVTTASRSVLGLAANSTGFATTAPTSSILGTGHPGNASSPVNASQVDQCWSSWSDYWGVDYTTQYANFTGTDTVTDFAYSDILTTYDYTTTIIESNGNFPTATETTIVRTTSTSLSTLSATTTEFDTWTRTGEVSRSVTKPPCALPSSVSQCQESWEAYLSWESSLEISTISFSTLDYRQEPSCTQASIGGKFCSQAVSSWLDSMYWYGGGEVSGKVGQTYTEFNVTSTSAGTPIITSTLSYYWPTSTTVVPGCTLGCQTCRVSGNQVKLLYWPLETGSAGGVVTTTAYGTTFTSPTVYISFDQLHALNSCSDVGTPMTNVIVPITNTAALSSIYGWGRYEAGDQSASFNFTDLYVTPVPDYLYASQPRCASSSVGILHSCLGQHPAPAICSAEYPCARTLPYEPVLSVPAEVRNLQPEWADCIGGLQGVYDPPQALTEAASEAAPTLPGATNGGPKTTAQSVSSPDATTPAAPSPTVPNVVSPTLGNPTPEPVQTNDPNSNPPAQTPNGPSNNDPPANSPAPQPGSSQEPSNNQPSNNQPSNNQPSNNQPSNNQPSNNQPSTNQPSNNDPSSSHNQVPPGADPSPSNALGVFTQAAATFPQPASPNNQAPRPTPAGTTWTASDGTVVSAHKDGSNVIIAAPGSTQVAPANGNPVTFAGQTISQNAGGLVVDGSSLAVPAAANNPAAVWTASNGDVVSAVAQGSNVVIGDSQSRVTVAPGANAVFNGQTMSVAPSGGGLVVDGSSMAVPAAVVTPAAALFTVANGDVISAVAQGSNIVVQDGSGAVTIAPGSSAVIDGQTISAASDGHGIVADGSTMALPSATGSGALWTASNGQVLSVMTESNGYIELIGQSTTMILTAGGSPTVFDGQTLSAMSRGGGLMVDGSSIPLPSDAATWTAPDGSIVTAMPFGNDDIVLVEDGSTITLDPQDGATTFDGHIMSVLPSGSAVVIDGTTLSVSRTSSDDDASSTEPSASRPTSTWGAVTGDAAQPTSTSGATRYGGNPSWVIALLALAALVSATLW